MPLEMHSNSVQVLKKEKMKIKKQENKKKRKKFVLPIHIRFLQRGCHALALLSKGVNCPAMRLAVFICVKSNGKQLWEEFSTHVKANTVILTTNSFLPKQNTMPHSLSIMGNI